MKHLGKTLDFRHNETTFLENFSQKRKMLKDLSIDLFIEDTKLNILWIHLLWVHIIDTELASGSCTILVLHSDNPRFSKRDGTHTEFEETLDDIEKHTGQKVKSLLGYYVDGLVKPEPVRDYSHRPFFISPEVRHKGASDFLYSVMNKVEWIPQKEVTFVPSLLHFYLKNGFEPTHIHIPAIGQTPYPAYKLSDEQKKWVINIILHGLQKGDSSLPFFVELIHTWKEFVREDYDRKTFPSAVTPYIDMIWGNATYQNRQYCYMWKWHQRILEKEFWFEKQNLTFIEKAIYGLGIQKLLQLP